ncbi:hypothetical protein CKN96_12670 [Carnobacterium maltaromaticum]|uniref:DUF6440 family protein n=2 Tax=Lactobacillales TaxID=186826 RepID=UPI0010748627|nr:DUF6440 family protein [Carnobacterium maltaromaticum]TFJ55449.1 hypothetical protein CKN96_12670 [Carnobacterium maltaromaticum]
MSEKRFEIIEKQNSLQLGIMIIRDNETGVQYLYTTNGAITPLLDKEGKPIVSQQLFFERLLRRSFLVQRKEWRGCL